MTELIRAGQADSLGHIDTTQGEFREQIDTLTDMMRQLGGKPEVSPGPGTVNDPLSAMFVLYVNSQTGSDTFVTGDYASFDDDSLSDDERLANKLRRISNQRLECGYTQARPFRTINRAVIEAGIITSRDFLNIASAPCGDLVSIMIAPGVHTVLNDAGSVPGDVTAWSDGDEPNDAELIRFNPATVGGLILPRGVSVCALDLRKTIIRPNFVPGMADETATNRRTIFRTTGGGYYYGMTFMDNPTVTTSHHLLSCFEYSSEAQLDDFYAKIRNAFSGVAGIDNAYAVTRNSEYQVVGNFPAADPPQTSDTVGSSSPYIYNCSIRSVYGLCGLYADGAANSGLSSTVIAQFTGVCLQRDMRCFQQYTAGNWVNYTAGQFTNYRDQDPDDVRMDPNRLSFHIRAMNGAVIQEVSVFAIGSGVHHWCESGAEITITNSNSNFGGCAALSEGYQDTSLAGDVDWTVGNIIVANDMSEEANNVRRISLGIVDASTADNATTITLTAPLAESNDIAGQPELVARDGYTLNNPLLPASLLWIENPAGRDYYATLTATPWVAGTPNQLNVTASFVNEDGGVPSGTNQLPSLAGLRVYIRRLTDVRTVEERQYSLLLNTTSATTRTPIRDYVIQTNVASASIASEIPDDAILTVARSAKKPASAGAESSAQVELRRNNAFNNWTASTYYRLGDVVQAQNKHWIAIASHTSGPAFDPTLWDQNYVHMETDNAGGDRYNPEDFFKNAQPLVVFDCDTDQQQNSTSLGWFVPTRDWNDNAALQAQYRTATDYKALLSLLVSLGFSEANAHTILLPKPPAQRERNPGAALDSIPAPTGAATAWANWAIQFRRPSGLRLFGQAWEYTGWSNYTKALPKYQGELSDANKFTYYFTNKNGGRVYPSGFNEEGFAVSSRGLEDVETGEILSPEQISSGDQEIIEPPVFDTPAGTEQQGLVKIATQDQITQALTNQIVDGDGDKFEFVVRVNDFVTVREQVLNSINLLSDPNTIFYVAADFTDIPDAVVQADGAALGDDRILADRRTAFCCENLSVAFQRIANRNSVSNRVITIRLFGTSTTTSSCDYGGTSQIQIVNGNTELALSGQHTCGQIRFTNEARFSTYSVNLRFTKNGVRGDNLLMWTMSGCRLEVDNSEERYHNIGFVPEALVKIYMGFRGTSGLGQDTTFVVAGNSSLYSEGILCRALTFDSRNDSSGPDGIPTLLFRSSHTGNTLTSMFRMSESVSWYGLGSVNNAPHDYIWNFDLSGSDITGLSVFDNTSTSKNPTLNTYSDATSITVNFTLPASVTQFSFADYNIEPLKFSFEDSANHLLDAITAAASAAGIADASSYYYRVGSGSVVNNVFKLAGETRSRAGIGTFAEGEALTKIEFPPELD